MNTVLTENKDQPAQLIEQPISTADSPIQAIAKMAMSGVSTEVVEQMKGLIEWEDARQAKSKFNSAFSKAKQQFKQAKKSGHNKHLDSHFSKLEDYDDATREALASNGLSWRHVPETLENNITKVTCVLAHEDGHSETACMQASGDSMGNKGVNSLQTVGIVTTYLKRYTLASLLGLVSDSDFDNDGNTPSKPVDFISPEQSANLQALIDEVGADKTKFLEYIKAESLEKIPASWFKNCVAALEAKRKQ